MCIVCKNGKMKYFSNKEKIWVVLQFEVCIAYSSIATVYSSIATVYSSYSREEGKIKNIYFESEKETNKYRSEKYKNYNPFTCTTHVCVPHDMYIHVPSGRYLLIVSFITYHF